MMTELGGCNLTLYNIKESKMGKSNVAAIDEVNTKESKEPTTDKAYLKRAEKLVRRMDSVLTDLHELSFEATSLQSEAIETTDRDNARFSELADVLDSSCTILFYLTGRMSRKYVGKEIDVISRNERKTLKK
jgi:hypothetical protein